MLPYAWLYILTNQTNRILYVGVTTDLSTRLYEHRSGTDKKSFTSRYNLKKLVYYEGWNSIESAIRREKFIKGKSRKWKERLILEMNPQWDDLTTKIDALD